MTEVVVDNQREHDAEPEPLNKELLRTENQQTHDETETETGALSVKSKPADVGNDDAVEEEAEEEKEVVDRRLTWIGEGLLDGEGLDAVQQLMNLPSKPAPQPKPEVVQRSRSKLQDFLAKEEGHSMQPPIETTRDQSPLPQSTQPADTEEHDDGASTPNQQKRQNKLLDFLASDVGERYLDDVYQDEERDEDADAQATPEHTATTTAASTNNKLLAFLARERGERVHQVEKTDQDKQDPPQALRPEPYTVSIRFETEATAAAAVAAETESNTVRTVSPEPTPEATTITELHDAGSPVATSAERNKLVEFVRNVQPPSRPKFVIFNPDDLVSSSSSSGSEGEDGSPTNNNKELRLKKRSQQPGNRIRFANPGLDLQSGVVRQAVVDHYGREELLDFVAHVDADSMPLPLQHKAPRGSPSPPPPPSPLRRESPPPPPASSSAASSARKLDGRLASFLRKFSSKSDSKTKFGGSEAGSSRGNSHANSPHLDTRNSAPPTHPTQSGIKFVAAPTASFSYRSSVDSESDVSTPVESKMLVANRTSFEPSPRSVLSVSSQDGEPSSKRLAVIASLRQLLEDCEKNELSDIAMVRISILLSTVNQIVREDLRKERPPQDLVRRMSLHVAGGVQASQASGVPASWVRSNKEQEEYERGHTITTADIASQVETKPPSPDVRAPSPQHTLSRVDEPVAEGAMTSFIEFETAQNLAETLTAFHKLLRDTGLNEAAARTPLRVYNQVKSALYSQFSFRQKQLFRLLDAKLAVDIYKRQPCLQKRVCVIGMGPVGMRAAVELSLLGAQVVLIDKRKTFSRENILHMWPWVVQDLTSLGAKVFFPQFCHSSAYFHVGTRQLQCILLKVALLLGVNVFPGTSFEALASPDSIVSDRKPFYTLVTKPQIPWMEFTAVLGACGTKDKLSAHAGIKRFVFSRKEAIGLVCYFPNMGTNDEKKVNEFSWTIQFKQRMFAKMREIGVDLENIVYYRGEYHYIVMTPKRSNLLQQGVLKINYPTVSDLVAVDNIDPGALNDHVSRIISFFEIPQKSEFARVRLFDFSTRTRAAQAANVLTSRGKKLYVGLIGDALMEPFWPEGLGTCRGFLSAMDACWMVAQIGKQSDEQILADRELGYRIVQHISGFQRDDLQKNVRKYNVDPASRYTVQYPATITY